MRSNGLPAKSGETIMVTRHGRVVARVDPARHPVTAEGVRQRSEGARRILVEAGFTTTHEEIDDLKRMGRS